MLHRLAILPILALNLWANTQNFELLADDVKSDEGIVTANKNVVVYSQTYLVTADKAVYNQNTGVIELFGNVNMMKGVGEISRSNYAKINLNDDSSSFEALFMMDKELEVWVRSDESSSDAKFYHTKNPIVSSCNVTDPDWSITATSAKLNKDTKFLHMFNPVFHLGNVPIFYLPYFGFSTDTTRRTGLLPPQFGYKKSEGFIYRQPIYFAPYNEWDFQIDPQIRTSRGAGAYSTFRFADSEFSSGEIGFGFFRDKEKYREKQKNDNSNEQSLKNKTHKGLELKYDRNSLFKGYFERNLQEGLWLDATILNDIDYLKLKGNSTDFDSLVTSNLNYFLTDSTNYFGAYAKYYIDTEKIGSKNENKDTLQELPNLQYHRFTDTLFLPNILYSVDLQSHRYERKIGVNANAYELNLPLSLHVPLFDELATLSFYENLYATHINYSKKATSSTNNSKDKTSDYINNYHKIALHTDLAKAYDNFYHTINFGSEYLLAGYEKGRLDDEFLYDENGAIYENFLGQESTKDEVSGYLTQYFYTANGTKILRHSISQGYYTKDNEPSNLKNTISIYPFANLSITNRLEYSHTDNELKRIQTGLDYSNEYFGTSILHTLKRSTNKQQDSYLTTTANINLPRQYKLLGGWQYDLERSYTKMWRAGITHNRKCWNYGFIYQHDIEPTTTTAGSATKRTQGFYFMVNFYPMGGIHYDFSVSKDSQSSSDK